MNNAKTVGLTALATLATLGAANAAAQEKAFYVGAGSGGGNFESGTLGVELPGMPAQIVDATIDDSDNNLRVYGGYRWSPNLAFEAVYSDLGEFEFIDGADRFDATYEASSFDLAAVGLLPLWDGRIDLFARAGIAFWSGDEEITPQNQFAGTTPTFAARPDSSGQDLFWSVGININAFNDNRWTFRSALTTYEISDFEKLETLGFSIQYRF